MGLLLFSTLVPISLVEMITNKSISEKPIAMGLVIAAIVLSISVTSPMLSNNNQAEAQPAQVNNTIRVKAGEGNSTDIKTVFVPQIINIKAGQTINWYNPTPVEEPHSVAFLKDSSLLAPFAAPFAVPASTEFKPLMPGPNVEPLIIPSNDTATKTVIVDNARNYNPTVIDSTGKNVTYLPPNSSYTMDGTEMYINSGWIWPEGQVPPGAPPITGFTITFEKPGIYDYICTVHPWMTGSVEVS
jgi:plastocyanin